VNCQTIRLLGAENGNLIAVALWPKSELADKSLTKLFRIEFHNCCLAFIGLIHADGREGMAKLMCIFRCQTARNPSPCRASNLSRVSFSQSLQWVTATANSTCDTMIILLLLPFIIVIWRFLRYCQCC
jgi:hypothetical protein